MRRISGAALVGLATSAAVTAALVTPAGMAAADPSSQARPVARTSSAAPPDTVQVGPDYNDGKALPAKGASLRKAVRQGVAAPRASRKAAHDAAVGDTKSWLALDDTTSRIYRKNYELRGIGDHIEVWVAADTTFPAGDCRNDLGMTDVTDAQVDNFVHEFDSNIYPKESASFSVPEALDGSDPQIPGPDGSADYWQVSGAQADDIVVLVDNVRDANYYDPSSPDGQTFIAGFFYSTFNGYVDRNIMTIDASDWLHRTGANPPDDSADPAYVACAQSQGYDRGYGSPRPHGYEGTFAHEYQHLLESYQDPDEVSWVNEGLSDYAQSLVGYVDTNLPPTDPRADSHIGCFQGYLPENYGGPENSLTLWQDQGAPEILCDYGAAYSFMMYLYSHYGESFMSALHTQPDNGLAGLNKVLKKFGSKVDAMETVRDWAAMMALDGAVDKSHVLHGAKAKDLTSSELDSQINWDSTQTYDSPGAPPNGSDYIRFGKPQHWVSADKIDKIEFTGAKTLAPTPVEWTVDGTPPDATTEDTTCGAIEPGSGPAALYSGCGENLDRSLVRSVSVPAEGGTLSFQTLFDTEEAWDFGFAQVSTDGGATWTSLATEDTTSDHDPGAVPGVVDNLPGFTGDSGEWLTETADLSAYAGKDVLLGFRYITDSGVNEAGFWVRDVDVAGTPVSTGSLDGWQTISQLHPQQVPGWTVQLIAIDDQGKSWIYRLPLDRNFSGSLSGRFVKAAIGKTATTVAALVMMDDPKEEVTQYGDYELALTAEQVVGGRKPDVLRYGD